MDFSSLKEQVSNITLYDIKAGVRKVQNAVMNHTEMEIKVREATNNEPWGASSTLMQEIATGTHNYHLLNEIMPMIYKRFTEKSAEEWRQIYKALQLLEFLVKNGSERVIDDARAHISLLKMLEQFYFIDSAGKDQGINVRNRAKELADLLSDVDRIRAERKKSRINRNKYGGVEGGSVYSSHSRYGGFGSETASYGSYSGGEHGDGGGYGGGGASDYSESYSHRDRYEEYDKYDKPEVKCTPSSKPVRRTPASNAGSTSGVTSASSSVATTSKTTQLKITKQATIDLVSFDDDGSAGWNGTGTTLQGDFKPESVGLSTSNKVSSLDAGSSSEQSLFTIPPPPSTSNKPVSRSNVKISTPSQGAGDIPVLPPPPQKSSIQVPPVQSKTNKPGSAASSMPSELLSTLLTPSESNTSSMGASSIIKSGAEKQTQTLQQFLPVQSSQTEFRPSQPNYFGSIPSTSALKTPSMSISNPKTDFISSSSSNNYGEGAILASSSSSKAPPKDVFSDLLADVGFKSSETSSSKEPSLAHMTKLKASASMWGSQSGSETHLNKSVVTPSPIPLAKSDTNVTSNAIKKSGNSLDDLFS